MGIVTDYLDPNAASYTDDEIVGKVNAATANITRTDACESTAVDLSGKDTDDIAEGTTNTYMVDDDGVVLAINSAETHIIEFVLTCIIMIFILIFIKNLS